jgi:virulence-associated protein VapD
MNRRIRQGIHFDLDTKALETYYPKSSWRSAYEDIKLFLKIKGFEHEQGSGYHSMAPMSQAEAVRVLDQLLVAHPWLHKCVRVCTVADIPEMFDFSTMFDKDADIPERDHKPSVLDQIHAARKAQRENMEPAPAKIRQKDEPEL